MSDIIVKVNVTANDIREGVIASCESCPIARAVSRKCMGPVLVCCIDFAPPAGYANWSRDIPKGVLRWIKKFDAGRPVSPFAFYVSLPRGYVKPEFWPAEVQS